jgi:hypothetical protein
MKPAMPPTAEQLGDIYDAMRAVTQDDERFYLFVDVLWHMVNSWCVGAGRPTVSLSAVKQAVRRAGYTLESRRVVGITHAWIEFTSPRTSN